MAKKKLKIISVRGKNLAILVFGLTRWRLPKPHTLYYFCLQTVFLFFIQLLAKLTASECVEIDDGIIATWNIFRARL